MKKRGRTLWVYLVAALIVGFLIGGFVVGPALTGNSIFTKFLSKSTTQKTTTSVSSSIKTPITSHFCCDSRTGEICAHTTAPCNTFSASTYCTIDCGSSGNSGPDNVYSATSSGSVGSGKIGSGINNPIIQQEATNIIKSIDGTMTGYCGCTSACGDVCTQDQCNRNANNKKCCSNNKDFAEGTCNFAWIPTSLT